MILREDKGNLQSQNLRYILATCLALITLGATAVIETGTAASRPPRAPVKVIPITRSPRSPKKISQARSSQVLVKLAPTDIATLNALPSDDLLASDRPKLLAAIDHSLTYINTPAASKRYPVAGISRERVERSLVRFRQIVKAAPNAKALKEAVVREFDFYKSVGLDRQGTVHFTGYYEAVYEASRTRTDKFKYPLYALPSDFQNWSRPHPNRKQLETGKRLQGLELAWLSDRMQAFLVQVQGSARLVLPNKTVMTVGFAAKTDRPYSSIGAQLVRDGKMKLEDVTLQSLMAYFQQHPNDLEGYLHRNESFVFFRETQGAPATGSIGVPVTAERSIATDKSIMPPGAIALIHTSLPIAKNKSGQFEFQPIGRFVLDQDTGGAIRGAGRVDVFMGTGTVAKNRAGLMSNDGALYYLVLK
jgi:membrane-bound lytic murein transglycosylase A